MPITRELRSAIPCMFAIIILYFLLLLYYYYYYYCVLLLKCCDFRLSIRDNQRPPEYCEEKKASWHILTKFVIAWPQEYAYQNLYRSLFIRANPEVPNDTQI